MYRRGKVILARPANPSEAAVIKMFKVFHGQKEAAKLYDPPLFEKVSTRAYSCVPRLVVGRDV